MAPLVLGLFALRDAAALAFPSRWLMIPLVLGFSLINALSSEEGGAITCMVTGHLQKVGTSLADLLAGSARGAQAAIRSIGVLLAFGAGVASGTAGAVALGGGLLSQWLGRARFTLLAVAYAMTVVAYGRLLAPPANLAAEAVSAVALDACELDEYETACK